MNKYEVRKTAEKGQFILSNGFINGINVQLPEYEANLFAAAYDLLKELEHLVNLMEVKGEANLDIPGLATLNGARNAIKKAKGE